MHRRRFLEHAIGGGALLATWSGIGCGRAPSPPAAGSSAPPAPAPGYAPPPSATLAVIPAVHAPTLAALLERLVPGDVPAGSPGARDTNLSVYVDRQLAEPRFAPFRELFALGLPYLDAIARRHHRRRFHELSPEDADAILRDFEAGRVPGLRFAQARFFESARTLALEGLLGDPRHGGNYEKRAWRWLGIEPSCAGQHCG